MDAPKISVVIPVYNVSDYLDKCLWSVTNQTLKEIEIIVVNDGSTDNSLSVIEKYSLSDARIKVINKLNEGVVCARNSGLEVAKGEYIHYLDGDDFIELNCYEVMYNAATNVDADIAFMEFWFQKGNHLEKSISYEKEKFDKISLLTRIWETSEYYSVWHYIHKKSLYNNEIRFDKNLTIGEDAYLTTQLIYYSHKMLAVDVPLYHYIIRSTSVSNSFMSDKKVKDIYLYTELIYEFMSRKHEYEEVKKQLYVLSAKALNISIRARYFYDCHLKCRHIQQLYKEYPELYKIAQITCFRKLIMVFAFNKWLGRAYAQYYILKKKI